MGNLQSILGDRQYFSSDLPVALKLALDNLVLSLPLQTQAPTQSFVNNELEMRLQRIVADWPECIDPYIALFKYYFRVARYYEAEVTVWQAMRLEARRGGFGINYRRHQPDPDYWLANDSSQRHYLFCLKALGVIRLRRGRLAMARRVLSKLLQLDPHDEIGGGSFLRICESFETE